MTQTQKQKIIRDFIQSMAALEIDIDLTHATATPEWRAFKAGYNMGVEHANNVRLRT